MNYLPRTIQEELIAHLDRGKSILLLGARQTGKTTLINQLMVEHKINLIDPLLRKRYERTPEQLKFEIAGLDKSTKKIPLIIIDEVQRVPEILDVVQELIDTQQAQFVLTGSSARKLRHGAHVNLLPGRIIVLHLDPFSIVELNSNQYPLTKRLNYGTLPGIVAEAKDDNKEKDLFAYVNTYLEEEIRAESIVRSLRSFAHFLELAASESGNIINLSKLSQEIGVAHTTINSYYQILEDCLIAERIDPYLQTKTRRRLVKSAKYIFFDLGVRRLAARENSQIASKIQGYWFEQFIGLELIKILRTDPLAKLYFWRDSHGIEVDYLIKIGDQLTPIEVKLTKIPSSNDIKNLQIFLNEYPEVEKAYVVCQTEIQLKITDKIWAVHWTNLLDIIIKKSD